MGQDLGMVQKLFSGIKELVIHKWSGAAFAAVLLVVSWKMNGTTANCILICSWVIFVITAYRTHPWNKQKRKGVIWAAMLAVVLGYPMYTFLWSHTDVPKPLGDERPAIVVQRVESPVVTVGQPLTIILTYINSGKTSATNVQSVAKAEPVHAGEKPIFDYRNIEIGSHAVIGAGVTMLVTLNPAKINGRPAPLAQEQFDALKSGLVIIFVHGHLTYSDANGRNHWTDFCYWLNLSGNTPIEWNSYKEHNAIDVP